MEMDFAPLLEGLNPAQQQAVTWPEGPLLIVAGAGTGKTTVLAKRIAWLIGSGRAKPDQVLALAFNEKAAREMEERVDILMPYGLAPTGIMTFHAFGQQLLEEHGLRLGLSGPGQILSGAALTHWLKSRFWDLPLKRLRPLGNPSKHVDELLHAFSRAKDEGLDAATWAAKAAGLSKLAESAEAKDEAEEQAELAAAFGAYNDLLRKDGFLDHGDQLWLALRLLNEQPKVLQQVRLAWPVVLVDEFQDTNSVQAKLLQLLCPPASQPLLTVVGDDDQAIYGFRGASLANLLHFKDQYPAAGVVALTQNYRCVQPILDAAYRLIRHNDPQRLEVSLQISKKLQAMRTETGSVDLKPFEEQSAELASIAAEIKVSMAGGASLRDHAVLVRSHSTGQLVVDALSREGLATRYPGERGLYREAEVRRALALVRALAAPHEDLSLYDLLAHVSEPWPLLELQHLLGLCRQRHLALWRALGDAAMMTAAGFSLEQAAQGQALLEELRELGKLAQRQGVAAALYRYLQDSGTLKRLLEQEDEEAEHALANLARFFERLKEFDLVEKAGNVVAVADYLDALIDEGDDPATDQAGPDEDAVTVGTVHQAKGLEWPVVFLPGLEAQKFPQDMKGEGLGLPPEFRAQGEDRRQQALAEERRLFYVAMTRAKDRLVLSYSRDHGSTKAWKRSPFLAEALGLDPEPKSPGKLTPRERLSQFQAHPHPLHQPLPVALDAEGKLRLTYYPVDDYLTCPFKYKIAHQLRLKPPPDQSLMYGNAFHTAIQVYHKARMDGQAFSWEAMEAAFLDIWTSEGFDSPEHEAERKAKGLLRLREFYDEEEASGRVPWRIEHKFDAPLDAQTRLVGRMDRLDKLDDGTIIISDYKTSGKDTQDKADEEVKKSLQLAIYALAYQAESGQLPEILELRFLEHGLRAHLRPDAKYIEKKREEILEAAAGIRAEDFHPTPGRNCRFCAYRSICPHAERV
jgi:DNA helicase-2/ATP-dependent DNA helicase PcrA